MVDPREWIWILGARLVEIREVDATSFPAGVLGYNDGVGELVGMDDLAEDSCLK